MSDFVKDMRALFREKLREDPTLIWKLLEGRNRVRRKVTPRQYLEELEMGDEDIQKILDAIHAQ